MSDLANLRKIVMHWRRSKGFMTWCILFGVFCNMVGCSERSDYCIRLYKEGGAQSVLQYPECSYQYISPTVHNHTTKCHISSLKGRRKHQEDKVLCDLDMKIDLGQEQLKIGLAAVFDGHGGKEASEFAVQLLPYYLQLHVNFLSQIELEIFEERQEMAFPMNLEVNSFEPHLRSIMLEGSKTMEVMREAILLTVHDIDSAYSQMALKAQLVAGTTATIALLMDDKLLIANVGDSKALVCSERPQKSVGASITSLHVTELTKDHHPDRDDEKARIEGAGGFVTLSGVPRVNGILAVSRAIGDVYLKRFGVIADPEVDDWRPLNASDVFLVVASDGIFEGLSTQEVCSLLQDAHSQGDNQKHWRSNKCEPSSLAECIVNMAYEKDSTDNLSTVVVPLRTRKKMH